KSVEKRTIHPYQLVCANNRWYIVGHDLARQALRSFVLSRMKDPEILPGEFKRAAKFNIADFLNGSFGIFRGQKDYEVVVDLDTWAADVLGNRRWHPNQETIELPGGGVRIVFYLDNLEEVQTWVMSWGVHATVVRPKALADRVLAAAQGIVRHYVQTPELRELSAEPELALKMQKFPTRL